MAVWCDGFESCCAWFVKCISDVGSNLICRNLSCRELVLYTSAVFLQMNGDILIIRGFSYTSKHGNGVLIGLILSSQSLGFVPQ